MFRSMTACGNQRYFCAMISLCLIQSCILRMGSKITENLPECVKFFMKNSRREIRCFREVHDLTKDLCGKVVIPAFFSAVGRRSPIG